MTADETAKVLGILICDDHPATANGLAKILNEVDGIKVLGIVSTGTMPMKVQSS